MAWYDNLLDFLGGQGGGNTTPATRPERALSILSNYDVTGAGAKIGRDLTGRKRPPPTNPYLSPEFGAKVAGAGGADAFARNVASTPPAAPTVAPVAPGPVGPPSPTDYLTSQNRDGRLADTILARVDASVGQSDPNAHLRAVASDPNAIADLNRVQQLNRTGIQAERDVNGRLSFTADPNAAPKFYQAADGTITSDYTKSQQYAQGVDVAKRDEALLTKYQTDRAMRDAQQTAELARTPQERVAAQQQVTKLREVEAAKQAAAATTSNQAAKLAIDAILASANLGKIGAETGNVNLRNNLAQQILAAGGSPSDAAAASMGRPGQRERFVGFPSLTGDKIITLDSGRGVAKLVTPKPEITETQIQTTMKANNMTREQVLARLRAEGRL